MAAVDPKERARDAYLRRVYGISLEEYKAVLAAQGHKCPVCLKPLSGISNPVDHDHFTGILRSVCCTYCNRRVIGQHRDWKKIQRLADYLRNPPAIRVIGRRQVPKKKPRKRRKS